MRRYAVYIVVLLSLAPVCSAHAQDVPVDVVVIAHPATPMETLDQQMLYDFFTRDRLYWKNGQAVTVFDYKDRDEVKEAFYKHFLDKSPSRLKSIWLKKKLMGEGNPPQTLGSAREVIERVTHTVGALGYVARDQVLPGVKVLAVLSSTTGQPITTLRAK